ncbi:MAG: YbaB/EbfC family nucleoid-associated protein [Planctomycetes bacterium]|nr:YbaB/EbfC family nucleoid-associated protein [Planctomycetota bacterium]
MLGQFGQLAHLLKNAGQIKQNMQQMQERLKAARYSGEAGGSQVRATVDGRGELVEIKIEPALVEAGDVEMLEDLICAAVREGIRLSREGAQKEMEAATGGLDMHGMMDMLGK